MDNGITIAKELYPLRTVKVIDKAMLDAHWPFLRRKLLLVQARVERPSWGEFYRFRKDPAAVISRVRVRWIPEQIRFAILRGLAGQNSTELFFFVEGENQAVRAFIITTCDLDPFTQAPMDFFVWLGWTDTLGLLERADPLVDGLARERGCTATEFISSRPAFARRLCNLRYRMKWITYRKELAQE